MRKRILILIIVLAVLGITGTVLRVFFLRLVRVPSGKMANTILPGDYLLINKSFAQIERGAIVVFQYSPEYLRGKEGDVRYEHYRNDRDYYVARVVGLPGESIQVRGRTVYINGKPLQEQKVKASEAGFDEPLNELSTEGSGPYRVFYARPNDNEEEFFDPETYGSETAFQIPKDSYFVLGDNRDNSEDSRYRGPIPRNLIWGRASIIAYSTTMNTNEVRSDRMFKRIR